jgi:hypothetical protein
MARSACAIRSAADTLRVFLLEISLSAAFVILAGIAAARILEPHLGSRLALAAPLSYLLIFLLKLALLHGASRGHSHFEVRPRHHRLLVGSLVFAAPHLIALMLRNSLGP